jgi:hypothetical protein
MTDQDHDLNAPPTRPTWSKLRGDLRLGVWRERWPRGCSESGDYNQRHVRFAIVSLDAALALAVGDFWEWGPRNEILGDEDFWMSLDTFYYNGTDVWSHASAQMGAAVRHGWRAAERDSGQSPLDYGNVVLFNRLRISGATASQSVTIWKLIDDLIGREFRGYRGKRPRASVIVMKAFPLEYEGKINNDNVVAFESRQAAMMRHYSYRMGAKPFDGGEPGWMWIEINCPLEPKALRRRRRSPSESRPADVSASC